MAGCAADRDEVVIVTSFPPDLYETYKKAFEARYPKITVKIIPKNTIAAMKHIRDTASRPDSDIMWATAVDAFAVLKEDGLLARHVLPKEIAERIPSRIGPYQIHDTDGAYFGFALSGYCIVWNKRYLEAYELPPPKGLRYLTDPIYQGHLGMCAPSRSGTTHLMVEVILQRYGWKEGWKTILNMGGNMASHTERSYKVSRGAIRGHFGVGVVVDFFVWSALARGYPVGHDYLPVGPTLKNAKKFIDFLPANIGLIKGGPNPENAKRFIHFLLSEEGQLLLFKPQISRFPVIPELYDQAPGDLPDPLKTPVSGGKFDINLSQQRYELINSLFDQVVTFRLKELRKAWEAIYEAENVTGTILDEARSLVSKVPISEEEASRLALIFKRGNSERVQKCETEWDSRAKKRYKEAKELADQAKKIGGK